MGQAGGAIAADAPVSLIGKSGTRTDTELVATLKCAYRVTAWPEGGLEAPSESVHSVLKAIDPYGFACIPRRLSGESALFSTICDQGGLVG
jgi:hypothetical protein